MQTQEFQKCSMTFNKFINLNDAEHGNIIYTINKLV